MDEVLFEIKRVHWAAQKFWRPLLARFGLTPARFDVLVALTHPMVEKTQSGVRKALGLARATISEMMGVLEELGLIRRRRDWGDGRTWAVELTPHGQALFSRAYDAFVGSGVVSLAVDACFTGRDADVDPFGERSIFDVRCDALRSHFGDEALHDFYRWDPETWLGVLDEVDNLVFVDYVKLRPDAIRSSFLGTAR